MRLISCGSRGTGGIPRTQQMIDHVKLFIVMGNLIIGAGLAMYIFQAYRRHSFPPLKPIFFHVIFTNLLVLVLLTVKYYDVNIGEEVLRIPDTVDSVTRSFLLYLFFIGFSYSSLGAYLAFLDKSMSSIARRRIGVATVLLLAGIFLELLCVEGSLLSMMHYHIYENVGVVFILLELGIMIALPIKARQLQDGERIRVVRAFSFLYIGRYPVVLLVILVPQPFRLLLGLLCLNAAPYLWCRLFMQPSMERLKLRTRQKTDLSSIAERYRLSPRETEILGLIMEGKSNRDMEGDLFISYHTVKNHVYNLYRKLGVKTRFELLHFVLSASE